jgi:putative lipoprotein
VSSVPAGVEAYFVVSDGHIDGNGGCNGFGGTARVDGDRLRLGPIATTDMACAADAMAVEGALHAALSGDVTYAIDAGSLTITGPDGHGLVLRADA